MEIYFLSAAMRCRNSVSQLGTTTSWYVSDCEIGMTIREPSRLTSKFAWPKSRPPDGSGANAVSRDSTRTTGVVASRASTIALPDR